MNKYLFLLGFFLFSISFLSGCKMSDFYSAPVTNADSAPVANADSALVADADSTPVNAGEVYKGIVYSNTSSDSISCNRAGMKKLKELRDQYGSAEFPIPEQCDRGVFEKFVLFDEVDKSSKGYVYVVSFISEDGGGQWRQAYVEAKAGLHLIPCEEDPSFYTDEGWRDDCIKNMESYNSHRRRVYHLSKDSTDQAPRAPDSIK